MSAATIQSLPASLSDAARLGARLGLSVSEIAIHSFPDDELRVTVAPPSPLTIVYGSLDHPNDKLLALLFAVEALRRNGAERLILVAPYLCYMRQDTAFHAGEAINQSVVGHLLAGAFDRLVTFNVHLHRTASIRDVFPGKEADNLSAISAIAADVRTRGFDPSTVIFGPDAESMPLVSELARRLGLRSTIAQKTRRSDHSVQISLADPNVIAGRPVLIVDDIISSGGTLAACAREVIGAGAATVDAIVVHALFSSKVLHEFTQAGIRSVRSTTSVPHPTNAISLDELLAMALQHDLSVARAMENTP